MIEVGEMESMRIYHKRSLLRKAKLLEEKNKQNLQ